MNTNISRNDFLFFQNEVFKDIKELEKKINEKINTISTNINSNKEASDNNYQKFNEKISQIISMIGISEEKLKVNEQFISFKKKVDDILFMNKAKISTLEKEINNITFKYDKIFLDNLTVPGIIGTACPFPNLSSFIDYSYKKIKELLVEKTKQNTDMRSYKEKLEIIISSFNKQIKNVETQFIEYCNNSLKEYEKNSNERFNLLEEKINNMRIENGKYTFDLIENSNKLKIQWDKIQKIENDIYSRLNEELVKHVYTSNNLCQVFNSQRDEFKLLKSRFTELSEFIKDVRFRNNINYLNNTNNLNGPVETEFEKKIKFRKMAKRINFHLKQKLDIIEKKDNSLDKIKMNNDDIVQKFQENIVNKSFTNFDENNNNKYRLKSGLIINKPMKLGKITSTLKSYFSQNKEYKSNANKNNGKIFFKSINNKYESVNKNNNKEKKIDSSLIEEFDKEIKPILKKRKQLQSAKNILKKNKKMIFLTNENKINKNKENISSDKNTKSSKILPLISLNNNSLDLKIKRSTIFPLIPLQNEISKINPINKTRNNIFNIKMNSLNIKPVKRKSLFSEGNKNLKIEKIDNKNFKYSSTKNLKTYFPDTIESNNLLTINSPIKKSGKIPSLSINQIEDIINTINNKKNINLNNEKNKKGINKEFIRINVNNLATGGKIKKKSIDFSNTNNSLSNNNDYNYENNKKSFKKNKFSFITSPNIIQNKNINNNNIDINEIEVNFNSLNKKITKTNKKINDIHQEIEIKIYKLFKYIKKVLGEINGKSNNNINNMFNFELSPKAIFTTSNLIFPIPNKIKQPIFSKEINKIIKEKKFNPSNSKKINSFKSLVSQIEPYLIKKFKI